MTKGSEAQDGKGFNLTPEQKNELVSKYPSAASLIRRYVGADEYINNRERYCIWLKGAEPSEYRNIKPIMERIQSVNEFREKRQIDVAPALFGSERQPDSDFLIIPGTSSENREYIPMGYLSSDIVPNSKVMTITDCPLWLFAVLESNVHMDWMRIVSGRLEMRYSYYNGVYYNFPWIEFSDKQKKIFTENARAILAAREKHMPCSLADIYDPLTMPTDLRKAHNDNDKAVKNFILVFLVLTFL